MAELVKINPLLYITDRDPIPEKVMDTSAWFKTESIVLDFGDYVGRPDENVLMHKSVLSQYLANGWYVAEVMKTESGGRWESVATAKASQTGSATNTSNSSSTSSSKASSSSESRPEKWQGSWEDRELITGATVKGTSEGSSTGSAKSNGTGTTSGTSETTTIQDGGPYWYAYQKIRLVRRRIQSELVLKDMIAQFTRAYNEGRQINDERYDELVSLYALMLSRTEDEANTFALNTDDFKPLAKAVVDAVKDALDRYRASVGDIPDDWMKSRIEEINRKFDALIGTTRTEMVSKGTYNSTVWPTTQAGIERQRQYALTDLKDEMVTLKVDVAGRIATMTADVGQRLLDCEIRIIEAQQKQLIGPTEIRNTVFKWMLDFMERRDDDYPGLEQIATIASTLGYGEGAVPAEATR